MRLSKKFLSDYINITDLSFSDLANKMVFAGNEYESIEKLCDATNLVVGEVVECIDHPNSDHLHICQVDIKENIVQIVCGAPNVKTGIKVIVAKVGATLPGGITIKKTVLAGTESNGMICSLEELGIESKYLKEEDKTGIHVLKEDAPVGEDAIVYLGLDDEIIDFELTADRADLLSIIGMAYEVGAIYNRKVNVNEISLNMSIESIEDDYKLDVETENCSIYLGKLVKNVEIKESPEFIKNRLIASGIRPINNVVDISNYVMLEYGQPLHFFDADSLGKHIIVRMAQTDEKIKTLDNCERDLKNSDIVIANEQEPVALAGVMGGLSTEVESTTKNIFIESAIFDPYHIRNTSKRILRSEASSRYEKGIDPNRTMEALKRACELLEKYASGEITSGILKYDQTSKDDKKIELSLEKLNAVLGMTLTEKEVIDILIRLGFSYELKQSFILVFIPTRRLDVNIVEDLIEEIGRIYGFEHIKGVLPTTKIRLGGRSKKYELTKNIQNRLMSLGLTQVVTYSLTSDLLSNQFIEQTLESISVLSPMSEDKKVLRKSLIPSLLEVYDYNISRNIKDILIFETGSIYYKKESYIEESKVAGLLFGTYNTNTWQGKTISVDFYTLKGIVENLLIYLGYPNRYTFTKEHSILDLHPGMSAAIKIDNEIIGYMGRVHPKKHKDEIYVFELSIEKLMEKKVRTIKYKEISKYPSVHKDLAFIVDKNIESETILSILKKVGGRLLGQVDVFDVYTGENIENDKKSIAYSLIFKNSERTLTDEEVTTIFNKMIEEVEKKTGAILRNK